jgi:5,10-methylenetetrahydromethanopterin reductase
MTARLGLQMAPWRRCDELVELGRSLNGVVDIVWVQDQMLARNVYVVLAALAHAGCGVGSNVTYAVGRNPIEMASAAGTISELVPEGREMVVGFGTGGALVTSLFRRERPVAVAREAISLMRRLWTGEAVELDGFPVLGEAMGYRRGAVAQLTYPVESPPAIVVAGVGPKILRVAGGLADGLICPSNMPTLCLAAFNTGRFDELSGLDTARAARPADAPPLRLIFGINVSVSMDREQARTYARRQLALVVGNPRLWPDLEAVGLDVESAGEVKAAFDAGLGVEGAAARMSDSLCDSLIVSGTPEECMEPMAQLRDLAAAHGFEEYYIGAPLGPDPLEAAELLRTDLIPQLWPERATAAR